MLPFLPNYSYTKSLLNEVTTAQALTMADEKYKRGLIKIKKEFKEIENKRISFTQKMYIERILKEERDDLEKLCFRVSMRYSSMGVGMTNRICKSIRESDDLYYNPFINGSILHNIICSEFTKVEKCFDEKVKEFVTHSKCFRLYRSQLTEYVNIIRRKCELELILSLGNSGAINIPPGAIC